MADDFYTGDYQDKTPEQKQALRSYKDALKASIDFSRPYFEKFVRFYRLYSGIMPPEIDGTFSKIMLWFPYSIIDQELPQSSKQLFTSDDWFDFEARDPMLEPSARVAKQWARYQLIDKQQLPRTIVPTLQSTHIFGTGYRLYSHKFLPKIKTRRIHDEVMGMPVNFRDEPVTEYTSIIHGQNVPVFNVFPAPNGGMVNDYDQTGEGVCDYVIVFTYPTKKAIEAEVANGNFDKREAERMFKNPQGDDDPTRQYKEDLYDTESGWSGFSTPAWIKQMREQDLQLDARYRLGWFFRHDKWTVIGEDRYVLYDGPPVIDCIPLAKFTSTYNLDSWHGIGLIEPSEDLIISMILNFNHRMDYLAGTLHPPAFVPSELLEELGGDQSIFDPQPYGLIPYNYSRFKNISTAVYRDRFPEISQQAFYEEGKMQEFLQEILGHPNLGKGMQPGQGQGPGDIGATGVVSLINQGAARQMFRAVNLENSGLRDSVYLTMKYGGKFRNEDEMIAVRGEDGWPWRMVPHEAITDGYGISIVGSRTLNQAEEAFKKMLSTAPYVLQSPAVRDQTEAVRQLMENGGWKNVNQMLNNQPTAPVMPQGVGGPGGVPTLQNDMRSMSNRNTVQQNTGATVAAGNILV